MISNLQFTIYKSKIANRKFSAGQAIIEVCVCLVAIVVVLTALIQLTSLTMMQTDTMTEARAAAAALAMSDMPISAAPGFLNTWDEAADGKRYTEDDEAVTASTVSFYDSTIEKSVSDASQWAVFDDAGNAIKDLHDSSISPAIHFGLLKGESSASTDLLPGFQKLIYNSETITIESEVWMTWTKGIY